LQNPWNAANMPEAKTTTTTDADGTSTTNTPSFFMCAPCLSDGGKVVGIDTANFDHSYSPQVSWNSLILFCSHSCSIPLRLTLTNFHNISQENFFMWSNGGWKDRNPIPAEYSSWNTFLVLRDLNLDRLQALLKDLDARTPENEDEKKLASFYLA
jgi:hypothetical protein